MSLTSLKPKFLRAAAWSSIASTFVLAAGCSSLPEMKPDQCKEVSGGFVMGTGAIIVKHDRPCAEDQIKKINAQSDIEMLKALNAKGDPLSLSIAARLYQTLSPAGGVAFKNAASGIVQIAPEKIAEFISSPIRQVRLNGTAILEDSSEDVRKKVNDILAEKERTSCARVVIDNHISYKCPDKTAPAPQK